MLRARRGFTLAELAVALSLFGVFAGAVVRLLVTFQRQYVRQAERAELQTTLRMAAGLLVQDLRELDATDPAGSDLLEAGDSSITYKAMRGLYITCVTSRAPAIYLDTVFMGLRGVDAEYDSVLVFAGSAAPPPNDDRWIHGDVASVSRGSDCPGARPSVRLGLELAAAVESLPAGSPVRLFEIVQWRAYRDAAGDTWLGQRRRQKASGWSAIQPVAGPLEPRGLRFAYYPGDIAPAELEGPGVSGLGVTIVGRSTRVLPLAPGRVGFLTDSVMADVSFRSNRR
ncbi:MAG TPA: prepilin-type N-terminal cleavage/methylation domain-containing protein [Gemmatimonadales bacterium]